MSSVAYIYVDERFSGTLEQTDNGYRFMYDEEYLSDDASKPVSLTLPLRKEPYISNVLFPFFDGLIPEGWLLEIACHNWKLNMTDRFELLLLTCRDPIGNVSIYKEKL